MNPDSESNQSLYVTHLGKKELYFNKYLLATFSMIFVLYLSRLFFVSLFLNFSASKYHFYIGNIKFLSEWTGSYNAFVFAVWPSLLFVVLKIIVISFKLIKKISLDINDKYLWIISSVIVSVIIFHVLLGFGDLFLDLYARATLKFSFIIYAGFFGLIISNISVSIKAIFLQSIRYALWAALFIISFKYLISAPYFGQRLYGEVTQFILNFIVVFFSSYIIIFWQAVILKKIKIVKTSII